METIRRGVMDILRMKKMTMMMTAITMTKTISTIIIIVMRDRPMHKKCSDHDVDVRNI